MTLSPSYSYLLLIIFLKISQHTELLVLLIFTFAMPPIGNGPLVLPYPLPLPILRPPFLREVQVPQGTLSRLLARCRCQGSQPRRAGLCLSVKEPWWDSGWNRPAGGTILTAKTNTKWTRRSRERGLLGSSRHRNVQSLSKAKTSGLGEKRSSESKAWPKRGGLGREK